MQLNKMRQEIADRFIHALEENEIPWHKDWVGGMAPANALTNHAYRGLNAFWLALISDEKGYQDHRWCTFKQASDHGWHVKKGEHGSKIEFWSMYDTKTKTKLTSAEVNALQKQLTPEEFKERIKPVSSVYTVFNGDQIDGIPKIVRQTYHLDQADLLAKRETLFQNMNLGFRENGSKAYYSPSKDEVTLPPMDAFKSEYGYIATMLHEAGHATGHADRLSRDLSGTFGSESYAREELRAEIASAFTSQALGLGKMDEEHLKNHMAYVQNWANIIKKDPNELFAALKEAEKISDYLLEKGNFLHKYEHPLFTNQEAARLRLIGKGRNMETKPTIFGDISILVTKYLKEGLSLQTIIERLTPVIDEKLGVHDVMYTKNIICSVFSETKEEFSELHNHVVMDTSLYETVAAMEVSLAIPEEERLTRWFGDYSMHEPKQGVTQEDLIQKLDEYENQVKKSRNQEEKVHERSMVHVKNR